MANLVENTRYNESKKQSPLRSFSSIMKQLQQNTVQNTSDTMGKSLGDLHYSPSAYSSLFGLGKNPPAPTQDTGFPVGQPIAPTQEGLKTEPLPGGYNQFVSSETGDPWSTPSDQSTLRNLSEPLGGGQYITDPTQPGALIKSRRAIMDYKINPGAKKKILGGLPSTLYQVDHIVPLWVGGADTLQNLQVLDNITHRKKTAVQAVPLTLLANNKITLNQARAMAMLWKEKESEGIPQPDDSGYVSLDVAEKYAKKWEEDVKNPSMWKFLGESFKESMSDFGEGWLPDPIREIPKGFLGSASAGIIPGTEQSEPGALNWAGHTLGSLAGFVTGLGKFKLGVTALRGLGSKIFTKKIAKGMKLTDDVIKEVIDVGGGSIKGISRANKRKSALPEAMWFGAFGQAGLVGREMTGQEEFEFKNHIKTFAHDAAFGALIGSSGQTIPGYATIAAGTMTLSLMSQGENANVEDAFKEAAFMTGLHLLGLKNRKAKNAKFPSLKEIGTIENRKAATAKLGTLAGPDIVPFYKKGDVISGPYTFNLPSLKKSLLSEDPRNPLFSNLKMENQADGAEYAYRKAFSTFSKSVEEAKANGKEMPKEVWNKEVDSIRAAGRELYKQTLPFAERPKEDMKDIRTASEKLKFQIKYKNGKGEDLSLWFSKDSSKELKQITADISEMSTGKTYKETAKAPKGSIPIVGANSSVEERKNFSTFEDLSEGTPMIAIKGKNISPYLRLKEAENVVKTGKSLIDNPEAGVRIYFWEEKTKTWKPIGMAPTKKTIAEYDKNHSKVQVRMREIGKEKDFESFSQKVKDDPSLPRNLDGTGPISEKRIKELYKVREKFKTLSAEELTGKNFLNSEFPITKFNQNLDNESITKFFNTKESDVVFGEKHKSTISTSAETTTNLGERTGQTFVSMKFNDASWNKTFSLRDSRKKISDSTMKETPIQKATKIPKDTTIADFLRSKRVAPEKKVPVETTIAEFLRSKKVTPEGKKTEKKIPIETTITEFLKSKPKDKIETEVKVKKPYKRADPSKFDTENRRVDRVNEIAIKQITDPKKRGDFTRTKLTELAKEVSGNGETRQGVIDGWPKFLEKFTNKIKENSGNKSFEITEKNDLRLLKNLYTSLAKSGYRGEVIFNKSGIKLQKGGTQNVGKIDLITKEFNKKEGFPENSMSIIHVNKNNVYSGKDSVSNFNLLTNSLKSEKYLPIGITGKGIENSIFVKIEPKMIERFEKNPEKYLNEGEKLTTQEDKFLRTYLVDVLKMPKDIKDGDFIKRANLVFHRYDQYHGPEIKINLKVLEAKTIGDYSEFGITKDKFENPNNKETEASVKSLNEGKIEDGAILMGENAFNKFIEGLNYNPVEHRGSVKALIDSTVNGEKTYHKGQFTKVDPAIKEHYKEVYGIELGPNDVISFDTNAKIGPKGGEFEINLSDIYAKSRSTAESVSKESPSYERKFISTDVGVKSKLTKVNAQIEELNQFNKEVSETSSKTELENVFNKYAEKYPKIKNPEMLFQGVKGESFNLGAAKNTLSFEINSVQKNLLMEEIITPVYKNSTMLTLVAPIKNNYDGVKSKRRYPNNKEVVLGEEQIKELGIKEGDFVVLHRDPSYDINNIAIRRVVNGTKLGNTSLGKENVAVSPLTERAILQGDQDADALHITRIGKGGISRSEVNAILKRGNLITPFTEVKPSGTGYVTNSSIKEKIQDQLRGDDQTSWISTQSRIQDEVFDNKITIKFTPSGKGSKYNILANGKVVDSGFAESLSLKESVEITPKWGLKERQIIFQAQREAVDSKKSKDISERTKDDPNWALKQLWETNKGEISDPMANAINKTLISIQTPYNLKKIAEVKKSTIDSIKKELEPTFDYYNNLKKAGVELTPFQEKILALSKVQSYAPTQEIIIAADKAGGEAVKEQIKDVDYNNNVALKELIAKHKPVKELYQRDRPKGNIEIKKFNEWFDKQVEDGKYTQKDLDAISYWAAASRVANVSHWGDVTKTEPRYIRRHFELINASPRIAEVYYEGAATYSAKEESPITESTKNVVEIIKKKDNKPDGQGGLISDVGSSLSNAWGGVKKSLGMGPVVYTAPGPGIDTTPLPSIDFTRLREAIKLNETNPGVVKDQYSFYQPSGNLKYGNANGAYQVTDAELNERSKQFTGKLITPKEFLGNSKLQDQYMDGKFRYLKSKGFTKEDILAGHRGGWSDTSPEARSKRLLERKGYVESGMNFYDSLPASKGY